VEELGIPELTTEQIQILCFTAEDAARKYVLSKVTSKMLEKLDIAVEAAGMKPLNLSIEIDLELSSKIKNVDADALAREAIKEAYKMSEDYLRKLK